MTPMDATACWQYFGYGFTAGMIAWASAIVIRLKYDAARALLNMAT